MRLTCENPTIPKVDFNQMKNKGVLHVNTPWNLTPASGIPGQSTHFDIRCSIFDIKILNIELRMSKYALILKRVRNSIFP